MTDIATDYTDIVAKIEALHARIDAVETSIRADWNKIGTTIHADIAAVHTRIDTIEAAAKADVAKAKGFWAKLFGR